MNTFLIILLQILNSMAIEVHDVPLALFHITESNSAVQIGISFDLEDFSKSSSILTRDINIDNTEEYLDNNTSFQFNMKEEKLLVSEVKIVGDHIKVKGGFGKIPDKIISLKIINTCLNNVASHSNIIQLDLNNESKDYRMYKKRTVINVEY